MNSKQQRILLLVVIVLAVLVALLYGTRACQARQEEELLSAEEAEREENMVPTNSEEFATIAYDNSTTNLSFARDEDGNWIWADDPEFPLDGAYLEELSDLIRNLDPMQTITDGDTLEAYGLETPSGTLTATAEDGTETTLILGKALSDGSYYLKTADSDTVYVVSPDLHDHMAMGIYEMTLLEKFPALTEENLRTVTISGAQITTLTVSKNAEEEPAVWRLEGEDVTGQADVATLSAELSALAFDACVDYRPSEEAATVCGFDAPAATILVDYVDENGEMAQMVLVLGNEAAEGEGRYARLNDSAAIYRIGSDPVSVLLDVAQNGMQAG